MSHYGEFYHYSDESWMIDNYLPDTLKKREDLEHFDKFLLAKGYKAQQELAELRAAVKSVLKLSEIKVSTATGEIR